MKVDIIGGGPAGLYFSVLVKKSFPQAEVAVTERNRADDTFGFGIVLSDETLANLRDLSVFKGTQADFRERLSQIRVRYQKKPGLMDRLRKKGLIP